MGNWKKNNSVYCCNVTAIHYMKMSSKNRVSGNKGTALACQLSWSGWRLENNFQTWDRTFSSIQSCLTLCDRMDCSMPGLPIHHQLPEFTQTHVHWVGGDAIQPSYPLSSPYLPAFNLSQHQGLFKWVISLHHVAKVLEFQLQHQSFQWIFRTDFL